MLPVNEVKNFIEEQCRALGVELSKRFHVVTVDLRNAYCTSPSAVGLEAMRAIAKQQGGFCLSEVYVNSSTTLRFRCAEGHEWTAVPGSIKRGSWCPFCIGRHKTIEQMRKTAASKGGRCLSSRYVNGKTKLEWECSQGHRWWALPNSVSRGSWCPECYRRSYSFRSLPS